MQWLSLPSCGIACLALLGCGNSSTGSPEDDRVALAREDAAAAVAAREEARLAVEAEDTRRNWFCSTWTALYCRDSLGCHPDMTSAHLDECKSNLARFCDTRMTGQNWDEDLAETCFEATENWDCSRPLDSIFTESCADVFSLPSLNLGDTCHYGGQLECGDESVCNLRGVLPNGQLRCNGTCRTPVGEGEDCSDDTCEQRLGCVAEEDSRGLTVNLCRQEAASINAPTPEEANDCLPHEQWVETEARCIAQSLPGEACGGTFGLQCLASACVKNVCSWGESSAEEPCVPGGCMYPYRCVRLSPEEMRCEVQDNDCDAHPMWLAQ